MENKNGKNKMVNGKWLNGNYNRKWLNGKCLLCLLLLLLPPSLQAQTGIYADTIPHDLLYLRHNKPGGMYPGDTLRFMVTADPNHHVSNVVYVDFLHPSGQRVKVMKLRLNANLKASGEIVLDTLFSSGFYELRAYTRYMANWRYFTYPTTSIPVLSRHDKSDKNPAISEAFFRSGKLNFPFEHAPWETLSRHDYNNVNNQFNLTHMAEKQLMVFGRIVGKVANKEDHPRYNPNDRKFTVVVNNKKNIYSGDVTTDSAGYYAIYLPDTLRGEYNLLMYEEKTAVKGAFSSKYMRNFFVTIDERFAPAHRRFGVGEIDARVFGYKKWRKDKHAMKYINEFFNVDDYVIASKNRGDVSTAFYAWLGYIDSQFMHTRGVASPTKMNLYPDSITNKFIDLDFPNGNDSNDPSTVCIDGPTYQGRPVIWILNGEYRLTTGMNRMISDFTVLRPSRSRMPLYIDEVHTIHICEDPEVFKSYVLCPEVERRRPITVFITTHPNYTWNDSALMSNHFFGYSK